MHNILQKLGAVTLASALGVTGLAVLAPAPAAQAAPSEDLVISEVYGGGGNSGGVYDRDFIELYNLSDAEISLDGVTVQYYSANGNAQQSTELSGTLPAESYYLVAAAPGNNTDLPSFEFDHDAPSIAIAGTQGSVALLDGTDEPIDLLGWGSAQLFEEAPAGATSNSTSVARADVTVDTDNNAQDFVVGEPTPQSLDGDDGEDPGEPEEPIDPDEVTPIRELQGTGSETPYPGQQVTTEGVVTGVYTGQGSKNGFYIQEAEEVDLAEHDASIGIFVSGASYAEEVEIGDSVLVSGVVDENFGTTEITADALEARDEPLGAVEPLELPEWPTTDEEREVFEGMLLLPQGEYTVSDNYSLNQFGEVGLAFGDSPLVQPTEAGVPGSDEAYAQAALNEEIGVLLDDGQTWNYMTNDAAKNSPLPYLTLDTPVSIGANVDFLDGVVLDYDFGSWRFQPTEPVRGLENSPVEFEDVREATPADVGGDLSIATFNVLNYFTTLGTDEEGCQAYEDREGNPIATDFCDHPRGAYNQENFERQETKIVEAINLLDASVVALEEIEDPSNVGQDRDHSVDTLVQALNAAAGEERWAFVPSPDIPVDGYPGDDVIRTAFIYQPAEVAYIEGTAELLFDDNFSNGRAPFAALFAPAGAEEGENEFVVIVNHFKSKGGSGSGDNENRDDELGPAWAVGGWNGDRVRQAEALVDFAEALEQQHDTDLVFITGDLNAYAQEDPVTTILDAGYVNLTEGGPDYSYAFGGMVGSLDHVLASDAAAEFVTGTDMWTINANEAIALEYSRFNYNVAELYAPDQFRSSDHNPAIVGLSFSDDGEEPGDEPELTTERESYSQTESLEGVAYEGTGFPSETVLVELVDAEGNVHVIEDEGEVADGGFAGLVVYQSDAGENIPMPVGTYTLRATPLNVDDAQTLADSEPVEAVFEIVADGSGGGDDTDDGSFGGDDLPRTGFDSNLALLLFIGLALMGVGAGAYAVSRRKA